MKASVVELRTKMKEVLRALRRNEAVDILYHGKVSGTIFPPRKAPRKKEIKNHPFFGMYELRYKNQGVDEIMNDLRGGRFRAF
ncbi:MAG: type II toxin-antitoxin system Phd/YefM family antitoxin [Candidatus Omnitrophica bacterium]|nr:type II toxin-antitoxin system Phd/YefM family antitoxin [Candidatus Omnitrophota bacterium]